MPYRNEEREDKHEKCGQDNCTVQGIFHIMLRTNESEFAFEFKADLDGCRGVLRPFSPRNPISVELLHGPRVRVAGHEHTRCG